ncbi:MAG TPA: hypothetical protein VIG33_02070 [Pseudobdellovibrionaceae bacterium]|jgi:hypothetical protein
MEDQNSNSDLKFKKQLASLFPNPPPAKDDQFRRIMRTYRESVEQPRWLDILGSPAAALTTAVLLVVVISFSGRQPEPPTEEENLSWLADRESSPLVEAFAPNAQE